MLCHNPTFFRFMSSYPADTQLYGGLGLVLTTLLLLALARWMARTEATLTRRQKRQLLDKQEFVRWNMLLYILYTNIQITFRSVVKNKKKTLYSEYLQQTVSDQDL